MDRRIFLTSCSALGLYAIASRAAFAADKSSGHSLERIDGLAMLATCPAICLEEIHGILNEEELVSVELDDLRYVLAGARHLTYLSGSAAGSSPIPDAVRQTMLTAPMPIHGIEKLLVMLTANQSSLHLRDIEILQDCIAEYTGKETNIVLGTINDGRMPVGEIRVGMLVPDQTAL